MVRSFSEPLVDFRHAEDDDAGAGLLDLAAEVAFDLLGGDRFQAGMDQGITGRQHDGCERGMGTLTAQRFGERGVSTP